jgi:hypothetical protein
MSCGNAIYLNECIRIMNKCNTFDDIVDVRPLFLLPAALSLLNC